MNELTDLERAAIDLVARENWPDFQPDALRVLKRENTGAGRYTYLSDEREQVLPDGMYSAQGRMIALPSVSNGMGFVVDVVSSRINYLEIFTFGNNGWDGNEQEWRIV